MSVRKRKLDSGNIRYEADVHYGYKKRKKKLFKTRTEAEKWERAFRTRRFEEEALGIELTEDILFDDLIEKYKIYAETNTPRSAETNKYAIESFRIFFEGKHLSKIKFSDIEEYKLYAVKESKLKPPTLNRYLTVLRRMFNLAVEWGYLQGKLPKQVKNLKEPPGRVRFLKHDEIERLLTHCMNFPHLFVTVLFALNTGLRKGEIHQLRWRRIDLHNRLVHVEHNPIQGEATKDNKRRDIPINDTLHRALMIWKTHHSPKEDDLVFPIKTLDHSFHTALKKAGITDFRFHDLRHTFASHLVMSGVDLTTVSQLMGHSKITMTLKYAHLTPDHRKSAVLNLDGLMSVSRSISETENYDE